MVGALLVIGLFLAFLFAGMRIARAARSNFESMLAGSLTIMIVFQAFLNIGCVIGLVPTTGKPLPFVSSGGSSLIATFIMVGLILSVAKNADATTIYDRRRANLRVVRAVDDEEEFSERPRYRDEGARSAGGRRARGGRSTESFAAPRGRSTQRR